MDVGRHEGAGRKNGVPGKRILAELFRHVGLPEDIPDDAVDAGIGLGDACGERLQYARTPWLVCRSLVSLFRRSLIWQHAPTRMAESQGPRAPFNHERPVAETRRNGSGLPDCFEPAARVLHARRLQAPFPPDGFRI